MQKKTFRQPINILAIFTAATLWTGCGNADNNSTEQETTISTDIAELKNIVNLDNYEPRMVKWQYKRIGPDNNSRLSVPGPSDYSMQAMLTFDQQTIEKIKNDYSLLSVRLQQLDKDAFKFDWLTDDIIQSVDNYDLTQYDSVLFKKGVHGGFIILNNQTVLLYYYTT